MPFFNNFIICRQRLKDEQRRNRITHKHRRFTATPQIKPLETPSELYFILHGTPDLKSKQEDCPTKAWRVVEFLAVIHVFQFPDGTLRLTVGEVQARASVPGSVASDERSPPVSGRGEPPEEASSTGSPHPIMKWNAKCNAHPVVDFSTNFTWKMVSVLYRLLNQ